MIEERGKGRAIKRARAGDKTGQQKEGKRVSLAKQKKQHAGVRDRGRIYQAVMTAVHCLQRLHSLLGVLAIQPGIFVRERNVYNTLLESAIKLSQIFRQQNYQCVP